jgi:hypothetical protein
MSKGATVADQDGVLELRDPRLRFGDTIALDGLSFSVPLVKSSASSAPTAQARRPRCEQSPEWLR